MKNFLSKVKEIGINVLGWILFPILVVIGYLTMVYGFNIIMIILCSPFLLLGLIFKYMGGIF